MTVKPEPYIGEPLTDNPIVSDEPASLVLSGRKWTMANGDVTYVTRCGAFRLADLPDWHLTEISD